MNVKWGRSMTQWTLLENPSGYPVVNSLDMGKSGSREIIWEALGILQARNDVGLEYAGRREREKQMMD